MRLIDADEVRADFVHFVYEECSDDNDNNRADRIIDAFDDLPTIDAVTVRHGEWVDTEPEYNYEKHCSAHYQCSNCGRRTGIRQTKTYKYCPNCGARMDGGDD